MDDPMEKRHNVLMVEDEKEILGFFGDILDHYEHVRFFKAMSGPEALAITAREKPEVILLDVRVPGFEGQRALKELKMIVPGVKVVVMTGWNDAMIRQKFERDPSVRAYFTKPVDLEEVVEKILNLIQT